MAELVAAFGSSHSVMLAATREDWVANFRKTDPRMPLFDKHGTRRSYDELLTQAPASATELVTADRLGKAYDRTFAAIAELKQQIAGIELDALIVVGDDQHELFQDAMMPSLAIYYGEAIRNAARPQPEPTDWYALAQSKRYEPETDVHYPVQSALAMHLIERLTETEFDICALRAIPPDQHEGHAFSYIHRTYLVGRGVPIVPVFINTYYAPNPIAPKRCVTLGRALQQAIAAWPQNLRVGIFASGGLSHFIVDEELDLAVLQAIRAGDIGYLAQLDPKRLQAGSSEIRGWICAAAASAAAGLTSKWIDYIPAYRTPALTGIGLGFARWGKADEP
jgi:3-O-methylgallate 3,4-dioxygenase